MPIMFTTITIIAKNITNTEWITLRVVAPSLLIDLQVITFPVTCPARRTPGMPEKWGLVDQQTHFNILVCFFHNNRCQDQYDQDASSNNATTEDHIYLFVVIVCFEVVIIINTSGVIFNRHPTSTHTISRYTHRAMHETSRIPTIQT